MGGKVQGKKEGVKGSKLVHSGKKEKPSRATLGRIEWTLGKLRSQDERIRGGLWEGTLKEEENKKGKKKKKKKRATGTMVTMHRRWDTA